MQVAASLFWLAFVRLIPTAIMQFNALIALGALLSSTVINASPLVQAVKHVNAIQVRELVTRVTPVYYGNGCFSEGTAGGIAAGKALVGKEVPPPSVGAMTVEYCGASCVGYVLFGLELVTVDSLTHARKYPSLPSINTNSCTVLLW